MRGVDGPLPRWLGRGVLHVRRQRRRMDPRRRCRQRRRHHRRVRAVCRDQRHRDARDPICGRQVEGHEVGRAHRGHSWTSASSSLLPIEGSPVLLLSAPLALFVVVEERVGGVVVVVGGDGGHGASLVRAGAAGKCTGADAAAIRCGRGQAQRAKDLISGRPLCTVLHSMSPPPRVGRSVSGPHLPRSHRHIGVNSETSAVAEGEGTPMTHRVIGGIVQEHGRSGVSEGVSA